MGDRFTFAVVGHDEAPTLPAALAQAFAAAAPGDRVWFVDSASGDGSAAVATAHGAEVLVAPLGKGRAMAAALEASGEGYVCFMDADFEHSEINIPARLREVAAATGADMVVGEYHEKDRRLAVTPSLYRPLHGALFPDRVAQEVAVPLSGFRAVRSGLPIRPLPPGYGAETHLNVEVPMSGGRVVGCPVGLFQGNLRDYANIPDIGADVAAALLDLGEAHGRLDPSARAAWDTWVDEVLAVLRRQPPVGADDTGYVDELLGTAARPLPDGCLIDTR